jgi:asparagine synthase (glutamine-hydrolysing)
LARDRAGEKPLYYRHTGDLLGFASELSAIEVGMPEDLELSEDGLAQYFMLRYVPAPETIYTGVAKLEPGMIMIVERDGTVQHKRFFTFELEPEFSAGDNRFAAICAETESHLTQSLKGRLNSDVPLGVFLSAGIDSTLSAALLTRQLKVPVKSFTIGFEGDAKSEHNDARRFAQVLGTDHREYVFSAKDFETVGRQIGTYLDEPNGDRSCVPTYLLSKFTRESVTVAISGDGGDEVFCGYSRYFGFADKVKGDLYQAPHQAIDLYFKHFLPVYDGEAVKSALPQGFAAFRRMLERFVPLFQYPGRSAVQALRQLDFFTYMPGAVLPKVDRMSMQHSLETRSPFYEPRVLEIGRRLATNLCRDKDVGKLVLRSILKRYVPEELTLLPKRGFGMPASVFINNAEAISAELGIARERLSATRFFGDRPAALAQLAKFAGGNINAAWAFIVLGQWSTARSVRI